MCKSRVAKQATTMLVQLACCMLVMVAAVVQGDVAAMDGTSIPARSLQQYSSSSSFPYCTCSDPSTPGQPYVMTYLGTSPLPRGVVEFSFRLDYKGGGSGRSSCYSQLEDRLQTIYFGTNPACSSAWQAAGAFLSVGSRGYTRYGQQASWVSGPRGSSVIQVSGLRLDKYSAGGTIIRLRAKGRCNTVDRFFAGGVGGRPLVACHGASDRCCDGREDVKVKPAPIRSSPVRPSYSIRPSPVTPSIRPSPVKPDYIRPSPVKPDYIRPSPVRPNTPSTLPSPRYDYYTPSPSPQPSPRYYYSPLPPPPRPYNFKVNIAFSFFDMPEEVCDSKTFFTSLMHSLLYLQQNILQELGVESSLPGLDSFTFAGCNGCQRNFAPSFLDPSAPRCIPYPPSPTYRYPVDPSPTLPTPSNSACGSTPERPCPQPQTSPEYQTVPQDTPLRTSAQQEADQNLGVDLLLDLDVKPDGSVNVRHRALLQNTGRLRDATVAQQYTVRKTFETPKAATDWGQKDLASRLSSLRTSTSGAATNSLSQANIQPNNAQGTPRTNVQVNTSVLDN